MAESLSEAVKSTGVKILWKSAGGDLLIDISTDNVEVTKEVCKAAIKLSALYFGYKLLRPVIDAVIKKALGGERDDQEVREIRPGSLHVLLHCFTDERFLAVLTDYESGNMKERLQEEFSLVGINVKGLKVEIQNMAEVNEIKEAMYKRQMASKFARDRGFEEERFESPVNIYFKCSICLNVLNNPKSCRNNEHYFCSGCIGEHLKNSHTCPECKEELTPATLVQPPRVLLNCILELRIKCDHSQRGCPEHVQLGRLQNHVDECEFAPAQCENERCVAEVNKGEKVRHETELCKVQCFGCEELKKEMQQLRDSQEKANNIIEEKQREMDRKMAEVLENQMRMKEVVDEAFKESLNKIKAIFNDDQSDRQTTQNPQASNPHVSQMPQQIGCQINHDIFVMGGEKKDCKPTNSVEKFCSKDGTWVNIAPMIVPRKSASSVVCENTVIVSGGRIPYHPDDDESDSDESTQLTDSIEVLNLDQLPLKWVMFPGKLPAPMVRHQTFIYKGKLIVVGTYDEIQRDKRGRQVSKTSYHRIYEISLSPPYSATQLYTLSYLSCKFIAELINEKLFIFGGYSSDVQTYNLDTNSECRLMPPLPDPYPLKRMASVQWRNYVILLGGGPMRDYVRDLKKIDVIKYNTITGESEILAPTNKERVCCTAVISDDVIIAMGGWRNANAAECYNFQTNTWQALPVMRETRILATAVVALT